MSGEQVIRERDVQGVKYLERVLPLLKRLHLAGCERDKAGNRDLHMDQYCALILLFMFSPVVDSLRSIQRVSELRKVQRLLGCGRASLGSLSESVRVFDPELLQDIISELAEDLQPHARDPRLAELQQTITLVDGTLLPALTRIAEAMWLTTRTGTAHHAWRLHTQFHLDRHVPLRMDLTAGKNSGKSDEKTVLRQHLAADHIYVMDRWYAQFKLFDDIVAASSSYVCRVRDNSSYEIQEQRELTAEARAANITFDAVVALGDKPAKRPKHPVRLIMVQVTPHEKRSNRKGNTGAGPSDGLLRIATNLLDVPAEIIALLYQHRFMIETSFGHIKTTMKMDVLRCQTVRGILRELTMFLLVYNMVRMTMVEAAQQQGVPVDRISFVDALRWLATTRHPEILPPLNLVPLRPGRSEPRCRKRRPKNYPLMKKPRAKLKQLLESQDVTN